MRVLRTISKERIDRIWYVINSGRDIKDGQKVSAENWVNMVMLTGVRSLQRKFKDTKRIHLKEKIISIAIRSETLNDKRLKEK